MKTISLKKVSAVAVAALALTGLSTLPANAGAATGVWVTKYSAEAFTTSDSAWGGTVSSGATAVSAVSADPTSSVVGKSIYQDNLGFIGTIGSYNSASTLTLTSGAKAALAVGSTGAATLLKLGTRASTVVANQIVSADQISGMSIAAGATGALEVALDDSLTTDSVRFVVGGTVIGAAVSPVTAGNTRVMLPFTAPLTAGTYAGTVQMINASGSFASPASSYSFTLTVTNANGYSYTTVTMTAGTHGNLPVSTSKTSYGAATVSNNNADFSVSFKNAAGGSADVSSIPALNVQISGPGTFSESTSPFVYQAAGVSASDVTLNYLADGRPGISTITFTVGTTVVDTYKVVNYGSVTKIVATGNLTVGRAGGYASGVAVGTSNAAIGSDVASTDLPAISVTMTDLAGNVVPATPTFVSANTDIVPSSATASFTDSGYGSYTAGFGVYHMTYSTTAQAKSGDKASVSFKYTNTDGTVITSNAVALTVGGVVAKEVLTTDKTTYAPGESMIITLTATDASGNPAYDGATSPEVKGSKPLGGTFAESIYLGGKKANKVNTVFAPVTGGSFILTATGTDAAETKLTATASVTDANAGLLTQIDALNAKIVALNALIAKIMKKLGVK